MLACNVVTPLLASRCGQSMWLVGGGFTRLPHIAVLVFCINLLCRGVGTGGATGARAPLVLQQAKLTYKAYVGQSLRDPVGSADHMAQGVRDAIGIATQYSYIIVRHYLEL